MMNSILIIKTVFIFILTLSNLVKHVLSASNYTYIFQPTPVNFNEAVQICNKLNASVLVIEDSTEDKFIIDNFLMNSNDIWLGIYDYFGNETNVNYYTNKTLPYINWLGSEPSNFLEKCARYMKAYLRWGDHMCSNLYSVVCKASTLTSTTTSTNSTTIPPTTISTTTLATTSATSLSKTTNSPSAGWSEWNPWTICTLEKKRRHLTNSSLEETFRLNISCDLTCKYDLLSFY
jgi:hypothetical protein